MGKPPTLEIGWGFNLLLIVVYKTMNVKSEVPLLRGRGAVAKQIVESPVNFQYRGESVFSSTALFGIVVRILLIVCV